MLAFLLLAFQEEQQIGSLSIRGLISDMMCRFDATNF